MEIVKSGTAASTRSVMRSMFGQNDAVDIQIFFLGNAIQCLFDFVWSRMGITYPRLVRKTWDLWNPKYTCARLRQTKKKKKKKSTALAHTNHWEEVRTLL